MHSYLYCAFTEELLVLKIAFNRMEQYLLTYHKEDILTIMQHNDMDKHFSVNIK